MTLYFGFDTETTGLRKFKEPSSSPNQPDLVQLAALLYDEKEFYGAINLIVIPERPIEPEAEKTHGISMEKAQKFGVSRRSALSIFHNMAKRADYYVAHNLAFDLGIMETAYHRENQDPAALLRPKRFCTMLETTPLLKIPSPQIAGKFKWPSLMEAYKAYIDPNGFEGAHDALADVRACVSIHRHLIANGLVVR